MRLLRAAAAWAAPLMRARSWFVPVLVECNFAHANVLGMNHGAGRKIELRVRRARGGEAIGEEELTDTLLHELSHIVHGNHSAAFYALWDELRAELDRNRAAGLRGTGAGFDARGNRVDGTTRNPSSLLEARKKAMAAAEKRMRNAQLMGSGPRAVGGQMLEGVSEAEAVRMAAMKRCGEWCGNEQGKRHEEEEEKPPKKHAGENNDKKNEKNDVPLVEAVREESVVKSTRDPIWSCTVCTFENGLDVNVCLMCDSGLRPGVWRCHACPGVNSSLFKCVVCETSRIIK